MLDFKDNAVNIVINLLLNAGFHPIKISEGWTLLNKGQVEEAQNIINNISKPVPTLSPRQFKYMLALTNLDVAMEKVLEQLRVMDIETYAKCKSQLEGASYFEQDKSLALYQQVKPLILAINPELNYTDEYMKEKWMEAYVN